MLSVLAGAALVLSVTAADLPKAVRIDPGSAALPANALRLYVWFDRPARLLVDQSEVRLLDGDGTAIRGAFMDFGQALWSPDGRRLTILFDPGRVKRDVEGSGDSFAPLVAGRTYQIAVGDFRWQFTVKPAIREPLDPTTWAIAAPEAATRSPLVIQLGRTMDAVLLVSRLSVVDCQGATVRGRPSAAEDAAAWRFVPAAPWRPGRYSIAIDATLEDVAGNRVSEALDHAVGARSSESADALLPFSVARRAPTPPTSLTPSASKPKAAPSPGVRTGMNRIRHAPPTAKGSARGDYGNFGHSRTADRS